MKVGKIWIIMILAALGFQVNAQRATYVHESYNSVRKYIHPLQLSQRQVADWTRLNHATEIDINKIERKRGLSPRARASRIAYVQDRHDRSLANILSRRQLERFYNMRGGNGRNTQNIYNNANSCPISPLPRNQRNNNRRGGIDDIGRDGNRVTGSGNDASYYDGGRYYRS